MKVQAGATQQWLTKFMPALGGVSTTRSRACKQRPRGAGLRRDAGLLQPAVQAAGDIEAMLPAPRRDMTAALQSAVDSYQQAGGEVRHADRGGRPGRGPGDRRRREERYDGDGSGDDDLQERGRARLDAGFGCCHRLALV